MENKKIKLSLTIDDVTTSWETTNIDSDFDEILQGFLGCMFGQTFVPGTEINVFKRYLEEVKDLYVV